MPATKVGGTKIKRFFLSKRDQKDSSIMLYHIIVLVAFGEYTPDKCLFYSETQHNFHNHTGLNLLPAICCLLAIMFTSFLQNSLVLYRLLNNNKKDEVYLATQNSGQCRPCHAFPLPSHHQHHHIHQHHHRHHHHYPVIITIIRHHHNQLEQQRHYHHDHIHLCAHVTFHAFV
jgi:hypothetical protein